MALNFPTSPVDGQIYYDTASGNRYVYVAATTKWEYSSNNTPTGSVYLSTTPPPGAVAGDLWWNSDLGKMFIYYSDVDSTQWVETSPSGGFSDVAASFQTINAAFDVANSAYNKANTSVTDYSPAFNVANAAYGHSNLTYNAVNVAFGVANAAFDSANNVAPQVAPAFNTANAAYTTANAAYSHSNTTYAAVNSEFAVVNAAFGVANAALPNTTGAVFNGNLNIKTDLWIGNNITNVTSLIFNTSTNRTPSSPGELTWSTDDSTLHFDMGTPGNVIAHIGQDLFYLVKNQTGSTITKGTAVRFAGTLGVSGRLLITPAIADNSVPSKYIMGVAADDIANGADGFVITQGKLRKVNTSAFSEGDILYLSASSPGTFQNTIPTAPNNKITMAAVITKDAINGVLQIRVTLGSSLADDELAQLNGLTNGDVLSYVSANGRFENKNTLVSAYGVVNSAFDVANAAYTSVNAGYTVANAAYGYANASNTWANTTFVKLVAGQQTITGDLSVTGNLTFLGNSTVISTTNLQVGDSLIYLAANNYSGTDLVDIGFIANYGNTTGANVHTGLVRDATNKQYYLFSGYDAEPANNTFVPGGNNMVNAVLVADINTSNLTLGGANAIVWIKSGYDNSNGAFGHSNLTYNATNSVFGVSNAAFGVANNAYTSTNGTAAFAFANGVSTNTTAAFAFANGVSTNTTAAFGHSNLTYNAVNSAFGVINAAYTSTNAAYVVANAAFNKANNVVGGANVGSSAPTATANGALWWDINSGRMFVWYVTGSSSQWVDASPSGLAANIADAMVSANGWANTKATYAYTNNIWSVANAAYTVANAAFTSANTVGTSANLAGSLANQAGVIANAAFGVANNAYTSTNGTAAFAFANGVSTNTTAAFGHSNITYNATNSVFGVANAAYGAANSSYKFSWDTTVRTSNFTASSNTGYAINTTAGAVTVTLPASPTAGDRITILDYAGTAATNNITVNPNGLKMQSLALNSVISTNRGAFDLVYIDSTQGWINYASYLTTGLGQAYTVNYLVVAGGGGGGGTGANGPGAGGGAGGFRSGTLTVTSGTAYSIAVGAGGAGGNGGSDTLGASGSVSTFSSVTSAGGGGGVSANPASAWGPTSFSGASGGSGGGGRYGGPGGAGNTPATSPAQGFGGGGSGGPPYYGCGGGGGAGALGVSGTTSAGGNGGAGSASSISGASVTYAGGGGGGAQGGPTVGSGGSGGGGNAGTALTSNPGSPGTTNTGGGGGGSPYQTAAQNAGGSGGSGIVIISYTSATQIGSGGTVTSSGGNIIHTFTSGGTFTA